MKKSLFSGDSEIDQLFKTFRVMGTPNEEMWPGITQLPDYQQKEFPKWKRTDLLKHMIDLRRASYEKFFAEKSKTNNILSETNTNQPENSATQQSQELISHELQNPEFMQNLEQIHNLVNSMLIYDPRKRISAKKALKDKYFEGGPVPKPKPNPEFQKALGYFTENNSNNN